MADQENTLEPIDNPGILSEDKSGTLVVGGSTYAIGLMWQPLQNPENPIPEIREALEAEKDTDLYCLRSSIAPQYGIGKKSLGHRDGQPSLAAAVASAYMNKESICAAFPINGGYYFVAIRNDLILSEEDTFYKSASEAQGAFFAMMAVPDWDLKIAPPEWNIDGAEQANLAELVKNAPKTRLTELSAMKRTSVLLLISAIIVLVLGAFIYVIFSWWDSVFTPEKIVALPQPEVIKAVEPVPEKPKPWERVVQTDIFLNKCWNNAYQLNTLTIPGWQLGIVSCTPTGITTGWTKAWPNAARIGWIKSAVNEYKISRIDIKIAETGTSASGAIAFSNLPLVASIPTLTVNQIREELIDISGATGIRITYSMETVLDPPNNPDGTPPPNQQTYQMFHFSVVSPYTPWEWKLFFDKFTGLELTKIEYNPATGITDKWKYEGRIYAK
ncbi:MAG: type 4b pilus protein PilO2 [Lactobacillales bacterium]|jgi:hypothetical protein|nr:type 4b pilus protein PilO2 [Lactobacillales bacterium]